MCWEKFPCSRLTDGAMWAVSPRDALFTRHSDTVPFTHTPRQYKRLTD